MIRLVLIIGSLFNPHYVAFKWTQSQAGTVKVLCASSPTGAYTLTACSTTKGKCNSHKFVSGNTYYCIAQQTGITGNSNQVSFTSK